MYEALSEDDEVMWEILRLANSLSFYHLREGRET